MKILMLGWEFPPVYSGGLGVVCKNLAQCLNQQGVDIHFAVPHFIRRTIPDESIPQDLYLPHFDQMVDEILENFKVHRVPTMMHSPYISAESYHDQLRHWSDRWCSPCDLPDQFQAVYGQDLFQEIERFAVQMEVFAKGKRFDLIHAHDWITFEAGLRLKSSLGSPLVLHVHATEMDRTGDNPNEHIFDREKYAFAQADRIITVSEFTREVLLEVYHVLPEKVFTVHNAHNLETSEHHDLPDWLRKKEADEKIVLFIGRMTLQKGPDYFVQVARKVLRKNKRVRFLMVGQGDMLPRIMKQIAHHRLQKFVYCLGFLDGEEKKLVYKNADLCVIPSVAEPFGLTALESVEQGTPVLLTTNSGVKEVLYHSLKSDFWDVDQMAEYVLATLEYPVLQKVLAEKSYRETRSLSWHSQASRVKDLYSETLQTT